MLTEMQLNTAIYDLCALNNRELSPQNIYAAKEMLTSKHSALKPNWAINIQAVLDKYKEK